VTYGIQEMEQSTHGQLEKEKTARQRGLGLAFLMLERSGTLCSSTFPCFFLRDSNLSLAPFPVRFVLNALPFGLVGMTAIRATAPGFVFDKAALDLRSGCLLSCTGTLCSPTGFASSFPSSPRLASAASLLFLFAWS
jgi:hypothetical protein